MPQRARTPNTALSRLMEMCDRWNRREHAKDLLSEDFVREDRRPITGMPDADRDNFAAVEESMWAFDASWPDEPGAIIASHGDRLVLVGPSRVSFGDGASWLEYLALVALDNDELTRRLILFEPEQKAQAEAEFDRLAGELGD